MSGKPCLCVVDDADDHRTIMGELLSGEGYDVRTFRSALEFMDWRAAGAECDLVISDINMPGASGYDLCRFLRARVLECRIPVILITGDPGDKVRGYEVGADEFIGKPFVADELLAKIRSLLRIREKELETYGQLSAARRFLSPNVARMLSGGNQEENLKLHRREVSVLFIDLRRFTAFAEREEPEDVLTVLGKYYKIVGAAALKHKGTLGHMAGDGIMVFFNDPEPVTNHQEAALRMALEARDALTEERRSWRERQYDLDFGIGIAEGYATLGEIGFDRFSQYSVIGAVVNLASRLCQVAQGGQVLMSQRFHGQLRAGLCSVESIGELTFRGIEKPVRVFNALGLSDGSSSEVEEGSRG